MTDSSDIVDPFSDVAPPPLEEPPLGEEHVFAELPETHLLENGLEVEFNQLRTVEFFALTRILTRGANSMLKLVKLNPEAPRGEFLAQFVALLVAAIPEADQETIEFLKAMTRPKGLHVPTRNRSLNSQQQVQNEALWDRYDEAMNNPEVIDLLELVEKIARREAADIQVLGKRLAALVVMAQRSGSIPSNLFSDSSET